MSSNGRVVPLPSDKLVPSKSTVSGYTRAVSGVGKLGEGSIQGSPQWPTVHCLSHPVIGIMANDTAIFQC